MAVMNDYCKDAQMLIKERAARWFLDLYPRPQWLHNPQSDPAELALVVMVDARWNAVIECPTAIAAA